MDNSDSLQLNPIHRDLIKQFLELTRYQLAQRIKSVRHSFSNLLTFKIRDNATYDGDEVREMLIGLQEIVIDEIETELRDSNYTSSLLIQKLLKTAEEWHLTLNTTISELEDREKLNKIKEFDEEQRRGADRMTITVVTATPSTTNETTTNCSSSSVPDMIPDNNSSSDVNSTCSPTSLAYMLKEKVTSLSQENELMKSKIKELELELAQATMEVEAEEEDESSQGVIDGQKLNLNDDEPTPKLKSEFPKKKKTISSLSQELATAHSQLRSLEKTLASLSSSKDQDLNSIQASVEQMKKELQSSQQLAESQTEKLRTDLEAREDKLRTVQSHLLLKEKELEAKFQATTAYINMKKMLVQKNGVIKELRQKLVEVGYNNNESNIRKPVEKADDGDQERQEEEEEIDN